MSIPMPPSYRGRLAPSPTGYLHLGHAATFWTAQQRARQFQGQLILRNEDLDLQRCRPEFVQAFLEDLAWFGLTWTEGPDRGGPFSPYNQSERRHFYLSALQTLRGKGHLYPCACSRRDVREATQAPHESGDEPLYPGTCRPAGPPNSETTRTWMNHSVWPWPQTRRRPFPRRVNWRFKVPDGQTVSFTDGALGNTAFVAGRDFGDFVVWRHDDLPSYQLAVVVDDAAMRVSEVVRGQDLLLSTARQYLLYQALNLPPPHFYHCPLIKDQDGQRLAKRHDALALRRLRAEGCSPESLRNRQTWIP